MWNFTRAAAVLAVAITTIAVPTAQAQTVPDSELPPEATCRPGDNLEDEALQGRIPAEVYETDELTILNCNTDLVGRHGTAGGYKVHRYVDSQGQECAFYDTTIIFGIDLPAYAGVNPGTGQVEERRDPGTYVLDMSDPANPTQTALLATPAFQSPHESIILHEERGLLVAALGNPVTYPGLVEIYDVKDDCLNPTLLSSTPTGILGHESGISPDGNTFYVASLWTENVTAVDISNPLAPVTLGTYPYYSHGIGVSDDGTRAYLSWYKDFDATDAGLLVLDVTEIQNREVAPGVTEVGVLTWDNVSSPQMNIPISVGGEPYLIQMDEFGSRGDIGGGRIIDLRDDTNPTIVSVIKLLVNQDEYQEELSGDPGYAVQGGYTPHYCSTRTQVDPKLLACTFIASGLRLFDISDIHNIREVAYFNAIENKTAPFSMSSIGFDDEDGHLWYSDGNAGFWVVDVDDSIYAPGGVVLAGTAANDTAVTTTPAAGATTNTGSTTSSTGGSSLPATGADLRVVFVLVGLIGGLGGLAVLRRRPVR